jgi:4,5-dihydroxyphthalate decarboxylase
MSNLKLTLACGRYDRTQALIDGRVQPDGVDLTFLPLRPGETFWRMLNHEEFDVSEMSLSSYTILRSEGDTRFIALPVFPSRVFRQSAVYVRADSKIEDPSQLKGKRIGVGDYQMTAAVWLRGFLRHDYNVLPEDLTWVIGKGVRSIRLPEKLRMETLAQGDTLEAMLERGEIDALSSVMIPPQLGTGFRRLFRNARQVEMDYYRRTRIFPIMHTLVLKKKLYDANPWLAVSMWRAFSKARDLAYQAMYDTDALTVSLPWVVDELEVSHEVFGPQIWDYSIEGSRPTLDAIVSYLDEQQLTRRKMTVEELFVPNINPALADYLRATAEDKKSPGSPAQAH